MPGALYLTAMGPASGKSLVALVVATDEAREIARQAATAVPLP